LWPFNGEFAVGVIDQRSDALESAEEVARRTEPAVERFPPERLLLTSECGFGHVPIDITRGKMRALGAGADWLWSRGGAAVS
jgi:5-methyltetrahydropteroyltriglutamate--homocysteine methyltransferase